MVTPLVNILLVMPLSNTSGHVGKNKVKTEVKTFVLFFKKKSKEVLFSSYFTIKRQAVR